MTTNKALWELWLDPFKYFEQIENFTSNPKLQTKSIQPNEASQNNTNITIPHPTLPSTYYESAVNII